MHAATGSAIAHKTLERKAALLAIEPQLNGHEPGRRHAVRQERLLPLLTDLKNFLVAALPSISRRSSLAGAIRYSLSGWQVLGRFAEDGPLEMTKNTAERTIRPLALGRQNDLLAGSDASGRRAAILYTLMQTATLNGLDPEAYLRDVRRPRPHRRPPDQPNRRAASLELGRRTHNRLDRRLTSAPSTVAAASGRLQLTSRRAALGPIPQPFVPSALNRITQSRSVWPSMLAQPAGRARLTPSRALAMPNNHQAIRPSLLLPRQAPQLLDRDVPNAAAPTRACATCAIRQSTCSGRSVPGATTELLWTCRR